MGNFIDKIQISGTNYDLRDTSAITIVDITQAEYDELPESAKTENIIYNITDATPADISQYWTSAQTNSAITEATSGKVDTNTYTAYTAATDTVLGNKVETSAITTSITSSSTDAQVPSAKAVYDQMGGMKIVKLTESEYTALVTKNSDTLYVVILDPSN